jgi:RNA polymerase sigma-70 factor (sigma-E family)
MRIESLPYPAVVSDDRAVRVTALFDSDYARLVGLARTLVDDEAPEVVQEAFARLYASWTKLRDPDKAAAYLRSTVLNLARGRLRRRRRERQQPSGREGSVELSPIDAGVMAVVRQLPNRQRDCVLLRFYLDLSEADIAATLGVSAGSVKTHLHRALASLAPQLEGHR